jgi:Papain family cysteine protease
LFLVFNPSTFSSRALLINFLFFQQPFLSPNFLLHTAWFVGYVSPVKNQGQCGSCATFGSTAVVETCYKKLKGKFATFSEQQYLDCAYGYEGAAGCQGAPVHAYLKWSADKQRLADGTKYTYTGVRGTCKAPQLQFVTDMSFIVKNAFYTYSGTEDQLKNLVAERSAVLSGIWFSQRSLNAFYAYRGGIFNSCTTGEPNVGGHAVTVVGYGTEAGQDYWLIKNSWGTNWGDKGFLKLRRGVKACDIGSAIAVIECGSSVQTKVALDCEEGGENCGQDVEDEDNAEGEEDAAGNEDKDEE